MIPIHYTLGDATDPIRRPAILAHICNDLGVWGKGFVLAVSRRWPHVAGRYRAWLRELDALRIPRLGAVQSVRLAEDLWIANLVAQHVLRAPGGGPPIRYEALAQCLRTLADFARVKGASVHMPRIGCGLAGGSWDRVEPLILDLLASQGVAVTVYDLPSHGSAHSCH